MKLTDAMNTYTPALATIGKLGYTIRLLDNEESFDWEAKKGDDVFVASDPLRLLGLISLKAEYQSASRADIYGNMLAAHFEE
ncbi:MAG: hypothetical protein EOO62_10250 [Hymenobacter sp.]|nr:MAG: hypothetical protein EOO62_10250 [Hymenobacter sp.]